MASKNAAYWKKRFEQMEAAQYKKGAEAYAHIEEQYSRAQKQIENEIRVWYQRFADNNEITLQEAHKMLTSKELAEFKWDVNDYIKYGEENAMNGKWMKELENASAKYHISRLQSLEMQMQQQCEVLFGNQLDTIDDAMRDIFTSGYYHTAFEIQKGLEVGWDFASLDTKTIDKVINKPWAPDGKNFSERVWDDREKLVNELDQELVRGIITGQDPQKTIDAIAHRMNVSKSNAGRLVMTEEAYFSSEAQKDCFKELDVEKFEVVETLDSTTCEECSQMDGKVFPMSEWEVGITVPPFHPRCRGTTAPAFDDEFDKLGERAARGEEGETYYVLTDMTYKQWEAQFVNGGSKENLTSVDGKSTINPKLTFVEAKTIEEAENFVRDVCGIETVSYKGCDVKVANAMNESLVNALNYCPELKDNIKFYGSAQECNKLLKADLQEYYVRYYNDFFTNVMGYTPEYAAKQANTFAKKAASKIVKPVTSNTYAIARSGKVTGEPTTEIIDIMQKYSGVTVNTAMGKDYDAMLKDVEFDVSVKYHPVGCDTVRSIFDHEFGHQLDYLYDLRSRKDVKDLYNNSTTAEIKDNLSEYGSQTIAEFIAEAYSEYVNSSNPRKYAQAIGDIIEKKVNG